MLTGFCAARGVETAQASTRSNKCVQCQRYDANGSEGRGPILGLVFMVMIVRPVELDRWARSYRGADASPRWRRRAVTVQLCSLFFKIFKRCGCQRSVFLSLAGPQCDATLSMNAIYVRLLRGSARRSRR